jgi:hypothetical protein
MHSRGSLIDRWPSEIFWLSLRFSNGPLQLFAPIAAGRHRVRCREPSLAKQGLSHVYCERKARASFDRLP